MTPIRTQRRRKSSRARPLVSVILCSYNRAGLVERAVRSVFRQTFTHWELVLVDDGSTDGSELFLAQIAKSDPRVALISRTNRGLARSRNEGLMIARGEYVAFLDSDDMFHPSHLERYLRAARTSPELDFLMGRLRIVGPRSAQYVPDVNHPGRRIHLAKCQSAGQLFARRSVLVAVGGFPVKEFGEDTALITKLKSCCRWKQLRSATYIYNCTAADRMCDIVGKKGEKGLRDFRGKKR